MKLKAFLTYANVAQMLSPDAEIDIGYEVIHDGKPVYIYVNIINFYQDTGFLALSIEGGVTQIRQTPSVPSA